MALIHLVRHARPASGWGGGDLDPGLDAVGLAQAAAASEWIGALPPEDRPVRIVSSPLRRCLETAAPTAQRLGLPVEVVAAVGEIPTPAAVAAAERPAWLRRVFQGRWDEIEGDLDYAAWRRGVADALLGLGGAAVFSHFVAINAAVSLIEDDPRVLSFRPDHASVTVLETDGSRLTLRAKGVEAATSVL